MSPVSPREGAEQVLGHLEGVGHERRGSLQTVGHGRQPVRVGELLGELRLVPALRRMSRVAGLVGESLVVAAHS